MVFSPVLKAALGSVPRTFTGVEQGSVRRVASEPSLEGGPGLQPLGSGWGVAF